MRCLFCALRNKKNSVKCQFCDYYVEKSQEVKEEITYLENGFSRIGRELDDLEQKVQAVCGFFIFKCHKYSAGDIMDSAQMDRIKSLAGKIRDDVNRWESAGKFPLRLRILYNEKAEETHDRVSGLNRMIQERRPTLWEKVGGFFMTLYRFIIKSLPLMFQRFLSGNPQKYFTKAA